jgi:predicted ferric reductase
MQQFTERQKQLGLYGLIGLLCLPFLFWVDLPQVLTKLDLSLYIALMTGFIGTVLMLVQFMLGTRSISGLLFRDLPWTLRTHANFGKYGTLLIFAHPIFMLYPYSENLWFLFKPDFSSTVATNITWGRFAFLVVLIVWITSAIIRGQIKYRPWKYIHYLSYIALPLAFIHSPPIGRSLTSHRALLLYWYVLAIVYLAMLVMRMRHVFGFSKHEYKVLASSRLSDEAWALRLQGGGIAKDVRPGQYIYLQTSLIAEEHPFTVLDFNRANDELLIAYKTAGKFTHTLTKLQAGDTLIVDGPYGVFTEELSQNPVLPRVYIAGGIGVTPFVRHILSAANTESEQFVFLCNRSIESSVYRRHIQARIGDGMIDVLSRDPAVTDRNVEHGHINESVIAKYLADPHKFDYFICGPKAMMDTAKQSLLTLGIKPERIHGEEFSF